MPFQIGYSPQEAVLTMTLSELAYSAETPLAGESILQQEQRASGIIGAGLQAAGYGSWSVVWGPTLSADRANLMYAAGNSITNQYAVVVRGTDWEFLLNWIEDFGSLLGLVPYTGAPTQPNVKVAAGTAAGVAVLQTMNLNSSNTTIQQFLQTLGPTAEVFVTGHSLGGCLAAALAPIVAATIGVSRTKVYTFAAPSPGNQAFADYYNGMFQDGSTPANPTAFRVYDTLDAVPNGWASLPTLNTYYQGFVLAPQDIQDIIDFGQSVVGNEYVQVGLETNDSAYPLTGKIVWPFSAAEAGFDPIGDALFLWQVAQQHSGLNYLSLLGVQHPATPSLARVKQTLAAIAGVTRGTSA